jgi:MoxR-like ATPase
MKNKVGIPDISRIYGEIRNELKKVIVGQDEVIEHVVVSLFSGGHILVEGVPGLAKTLLATSLSLVLGGAFKRIQFTPDLMPADIVGTTVYNTRTNKFEVKKGAVFANILLADEINRSPAKTQSALLEAMQEKQVTIDGTMYPLGDFFMVIATQNPIEMEGTYPLPEAQIDRFLMKILIEYPPREAENQVLKNYRDGFSAQNPAASGLKKLITEKDLAEIKSVLASVVVDDKIIDYVTRITSATRNGSGIAVGSSPRGSVALFQASRVKAALEGRDFVTPDDVKILAMPVLRHRIILEPEEEIEGIKPDHLLRKIIDEIEVPR